MGAEFFTRSPRSEKARTLDQRRRRRRFAPSLKNNEEPIELILEAIAKRATTPVPTSRSALDPASSEFYEQASYVFSRSDKKRAQLRRDGRILCRMGQALSDRFDRGRTRGRRLGRMATG